MTEKQVLAQYRRYNKKYFDGKLPHNIPVKFVDMSKTNMCGLSTMVATDGLVLQAIYLDTRLASWTNILLFSLLHEMCHVKLHPVSTADDPHGQEFDDEMMRLAFRGAFKRLW
jgi:hypothetical protein